MTIKVNREHQINRAEGFARIIFDNAEYESRLLDELGFHVSAKKARQIANLALDIDKVLSRESK